MKKSGGNGIFFEVMPGGAKQPSRKVIKQNKTSEMLEFFEHRRRNSEKITHTENPASILTEDELLFYFRNIPELRQYVSDTIETWKKNSKKAIEAYCDFKREYLNASGPGPGPGPDLLEIKKLMEENPVIARMIKALCNNEKYAECAAFEFETFVERKLS
jgi:hypothetical protein